MTYLTDNPYLRRKRGTNEFELTEEAETLQRALESVPRLPRTFAAWKYEQDYRGADRFARFVAECPNVATMLIDDLLAHFDKLSGR